MSRRYPYRSAGIVAAIIFGLGGLVLGYAAGLVAHGISPLVAAPLTAVISAAAAYLVYASESDRRPPVMWQASLADGIIAGITSGIAVGLILVLIGGHAGASSGPSSWQVAAGVGSGIVVGLVGGAVLGMLTLALGGPGRMTRLPAPQPARRRKRASAKRRR